MASTDQRRRSVTKIDGTVRYFSVELKDALDIAETIDIWSMLSDGFRRPKRFVTP